MDNNDHNQDMLNTLLKIQRQVSNIEGSISNLNDIQQTANKARREAITADNKAKNNQSSINKLWGLASALIVAVVSGFIKMIGG